MGIDSNQMDSNAKREAEFFGHIYKGSSGDDLITVVEGCVEGMRLRGAQRRDT